MKKILLMVPILGLMLSCRGEEKQTEPVSEEVQEQVQEIEKSTEKLEESIHSSDSIMGKSQRKIDSLLSNI